MRNILFKAKKTKDKEWIEGHFAVHPKGDCSISVILDKCRNAPDCDPMWQKVLISHEVDPNTLCQYSEQDIEKNKIWENDILEYDGDGCARCIGVVKYGNYIQDGSGGEYSGRECIGFYVEMIKIIPYEWENESVEEILEYFPHYYKKYSLAEILKQKDVKKVGNIFDNQNLLKEK